MVVATALDLPPFEFIRGGTTPTGFNTQLLDALRHTAEFKIGQDFIPLDGILPGVANGKYDAAVSAVLITRERQADFDFTRPTAEATSFLVKRQNDASIGSLPDLSGRKLGVQAGSTPQARLPELEGMLKATGGKLGEVVEYKTYPEAYQDLAAGRIDYVVNSIIDLQLLIRDKPETFALGEPVSSRQYFAWAVKKGNTDILDFFNDFLRDQRESLNLYKLQKKWFGKAFLDMPRKFTAT
jgi:polar amino acid transport system substrate-binding protein